MAANIVYRKLRQYKFQLVDDNYTVGIELKPADDIRIENFIELTSDGKLTIMKGYAWDGPSGPTFDTRNFMRGSVVHDALYQLIREGKFEKKDNEKRRAFADDLLKKMCIEDGMSKLRAWYVHKAVRWFGKAAAKKTAEFRRKYIAP